MDWAAIITAVAALAAAIGGIIANVKSNQKTLALLDYRMKETEKRLDSVDEHLKEHNGYAAKFAESSTDIKLIQKDIEYLRGGKE